MTSNQDYLGILNDQAHVELILGIPRLSRQRIIPGLQFAYTRLNCFPCSIEVDADDDDYFSHELVIKMLKEKYNYEPKTSISIRKTNTVKDNEDDRLIELPNEQIMIFIDSSFRLSDAMNDKKIDKKTKPFVFDSYTIYFKPENYDKMNEIVEEIDKYKLKKEKTKHINMICMERDYDEDDELTEYFSLRSMDIKDPKITDLKLHYGETFEQKNEIIMNSLSKENTSGIVLLHGLPGSGKTHYIRYLIKHLTNKTLIYVPPEMVSCLSSPKFFEFMLENSNSILIIEDAENIIKSRDEKGTTTQAVANLLSLSDGLLGDSLHMPVIATFNCDLSAIDSALLRKGRLIAEHKFDKLSVENSQKLSDHLGFKTKISEPMTLADIYYQNLD